MYLPRENKRLCEYAQQSKHVQVVQLSYCSSNHKGSQLLLCSSLHMQLQKASLGENVMALLDIFFGVNARI